MGSIPSAPGPTDAEATPYPRVALRATTAAVAVAAGTLPVLLLALTIKTRWSPALRVDDGARDDLHRYALSHPGFTAVMEGVSALSGAVGWQVVSVGLIGWLLWRRRPRAAVFALVANAGSSLLNTTLKDLVNRHR